MGPKREDQLDPSPDEENPAGERDPEEVRFERLTLLRWGDEGPIWD